MSNDNIKTRAKFVTASLALTFGLGAGGFYWGLKQGQYCIDALQSHDKQPSSVSAMTANAECRLFEYAPVEPQ